MDDSVLFRVDWKLKTDIPAGLLAVAEQQQQQGGNLPDSNVISITSGSDEKYLCTIPDVTETVNLFYF